MEILLEQRVLMHLLKESLTGQTAQMPEQWLREADWEAVLREAKSQAVVLQAYDAAGAYEPWIPAEIYQRWFRMATKLLQRNMRVQMAQNELTKLLDSQNLPYAILKGTASAQYYPRPELRALGDIDFLIDPAQEQQVRQCLTAAGYETDGKDVDHHAVYLRGKMSYEMHFQPAGMPEGLPGERISAYLENLLSQTRPATCDMAVFASPAPAQHGMIILLHMLHHMLGGGVGLRHVCDWAVFVQKTAGEAFWQTELVPLMRSCGLLRYTSVMTIICADVLGIQLPDWCEAVEPELVEAVLIDTLTGGNFGRKELDRSRESSIVSMKDSSKDEGPFRNAFAVLHESTPRLHPIVKKHPILHPFFDLCRGIRFIFRCLFGSRRWITTMLPKAKERRTVYEQLRIFETE